MIPNLKRLRKAKGYKQLQVAEYLGVSKQVYSNYELGKREADYETLLKLAEFFDTTVDNLLTGQNPPLRKIVVRKNIIDAAKNKNYKNLATKTVIIKNEPASEGDRRLKEAEKMTDAELMRHLGVMLRELEKRYQSSGSESSSVGKSSKDT